MRCSSCVGVVLAGFLVCLVVVAGAHQWEESVESLKRVLESAVSDVEGAKQAFEGLAQAELDVLRQKLNILAGQIEAAELSKRSLGQRIRGFVTIQVIVATTVYLLLGRYNKRANRQALKQQKFAQEFAERLAKQVADKAAKEQTTTAEETAKTASSGATEQSAAESEAAAPMSVINAEGEVEEEHINPFINRTIILTPHERIKMSIMTVTIFPVRFFVFVVSTVLALIVCHLTVLGLNKRQLGAKPLPRWRRLVRSLGKPVQRAMLFALGFQYIRQKGRPAPRGKAPVVISNHNGFVEPMLLQYMLTVSAIGKAELGRIPIISSLFLAFQTVFVDRVSSNSRHETLERIRDRATSKDSWDRLLIFPEGTCTNGCGLITFKSGAFTPGVPIQPVCVRYPFKHCDVACVKQGPQTLFLMYKLMCQFHNNAEVTFLPVYEPNEEEKANPQLYAANVRKLMAKHLGVPTTDHTFEDVLLQLYAKKLGEPMEHVLLEIKKLQKFLDLNLDTVRGYLERFAALDTSKSGRITLEQFAQGFRTDISPEVRGLFDTIDHDHDGTLDFRDFLIGISVLNDKGSGKTKDTLQLAFRVFDAEGKGYLTKTQLAVILRRVYPEMPDAKVDKYFAEADRKGKGQIDLEDFMVFAQKYESKIQLFRSALF